MKHERWALLACALALSCERTKVELQSQGDGSCVFTGNVTHLACTADACMLCRDGKTCQWVTYRHCGP